MAIVSRQQVAVILASNVGLISGGCCATAGVCFFVVVELVFFAPYFLSVAGVLHETLFYGNRWLYCALHTDVYLFIWLYNIFRAATID